MNRNRSSGILLHVTSLASRYGVGDLGPEARRFVDFLRGNGQRYWQMLPLNPTSPVHGNSPYSSDSAFAGNPLLISPEDMVRDGLLRPQDVHDLPEIPVSRVKYADAMALRESLLDKAFTESGRSPAVREFRVRQKAWLEDFALFRALKAHFHGQPWTAWPEDVRRRKDAAMQRFRDSLHDEIDRICFQQFVFFEQWRSLRSYCRDKGVELIGDVPIYVNEDSVEVWANPELFKLDEHLRPRFLAGVPPDYFSETGQLWGNPVYDWKQMEREDFAWWIRRIRHNIELFDLVRLDHFRGFVACWEVPAGHETAMHGQWVDVPAQSFFQRLARTFNPLPLIAEDLGTIDDAVRNVMHKFGLPGMKILLFAFGPDLPTNPYAPHNHVPDCLVYTGTHDNNTVRGWFEEEADAETRARLDAYLGISCTSENVALAFVRMGMQSVADVVVFPLQDILGLGGESKMNVPGVANGNWSWRMPPDALARMTGGDDNHVATGMLDNPPCLAGGRLLEMTTLYGRGPARQCD
ncbi:4-alpha-glucanotransferase [Desulfonatronum thioautotrophicum]|uniref:4-alpha-glucanotransferase n=1 Tax=Desulfonatronum thioautotrophicum TaxID=617001 RepID=UPI0009FEBAAB|nr:4-alpha-glucanotransferase [Desulfonatronum thioautotrophicum]